MTAQRERFLAALDAEIKSLSKLAHTLARTKLLLQEHVTRLRLGVSPEVVMTSLRLSVPHETTLALLERVDPVLAGPAAPRPQRTNEGLKSDLMS
ncbi:MAG: hypothetical protein DMD96_26010 [Candidatus Rokuibacteriota bacterium]|nr:MAG: hypothetical protein DMD96_26010 [Candidatus Rokubacteria bacterium]